MTPRARKEFVTWFRSAIAQMIAGIRRLLAEGDRRAANRWSTYMLDVLVMLDPPRRTRRRRTAKGKAS